LRKHILTLREESVCGRKCLRKKVL